jgi:hypothetical protein
MKKLLLMLLLAVAAHGQNVSYTASTESFPNPERGFYRYSSSGSSSTTYSFLSASKLNGYRAQNHTVILRMFYLQQFVASPISSTFLANMQTDFNTIRNAGMKVMIRFAYSNSESAAVLDATKAQTLAHIQQVAPIIQANRDVIATYQYGWIGAWGETYYTSQVAEYGNQDYNSYTATQWANRKEILDAMLNSTPAEIPVQVRYLLYKQRFYPRGNNRVGFYNDSFLGTWGDSGTFQVSSSSSAPSSSDINYLSTQTDILPMTGETNQINSPRTNCSNAVSEMDKYNWSLINKDYLPANISNWTTNGCYADMDRRLGYRFELQNSSFDNNILTINLTNYGFANVYKSRKAFVILRNTATGTEYSVEISNDIRTWKKGFPTQLTTDFTGIVPGGTYQLFLSLPDPLLSSPLYAIRFANTGLWDAVKGRNNLNQTVAVTGSTGGTSVVSEPVVVAPVSAVEILFINNTTLIINNLPSQNFSIKVFNLNGRVRARSTDLSGLRSGYYVVKVYCNGQEYTKNIYKQ